MNSSSGRTSGAVSSTGLLLRIHRPDGQVDEFYVAHGLTIGRSEANTVELAGDMSVERSHARIEVSGGAARLKCVATEGQLVVNGAKVRELALAPGIGFRVGKTVFECVPGLLAPSAGASALDAVCPYCRSRDVTLGIKTIQACPSCKRSILVVNLGPPDHRTMVIPAKLGDSKVEALVARGGMGLVLKGQNQGKFPVAIKVPLLDKAINKESFERFRQEVAMLKRVRHPNVVKLLEYGHAGRTNYLTMEWIEGQSLREYIAALRNRRECIQFDVALRWLEQICKGLAAIHAVGVVHRDIKPSNILIGPQSTALISDLGIAKGGDATGDLTTTGELLGTHEYMAPEQISAPAMVDHRTDLYSLGVTIYELLTGGRPVGAWLPASQVNRTVPASFDRILKSLLAPRMENRCADVHQLIAEVRNLTMAVAAEPGKPSEERRGRGAKAKYVWLAISGLFVVTGLVVVGVDLQNSPAPVTRRQNCPTASKTHRQNHTATCAGQLVGRSGVAQKRNRRKDF